MAENLHGREYLVRMFVVGLTQGRDCRISVPVQIGDQGIQALHLLFESQNKLLTTTELSNTIIVRLVESSSLSPYDAYVLGYSISQSQCQWELYLDVISAEHAEMMKRAITTWGPVKGKIIQISSIECSLSSDGIGQLLSLPHPILSDLSKLILVHKEVDVKTLQQAIPSPILLTLFRIPMS